MGKHVFHHLIKHVRRKRGVMECYGLDYQRDDFSAGGEDYTTLRFTVGRDRVDDFLAAVHWPPAPPGRDPESGDDDG